MVLIRPWHYFPLGVHSKSELQPLRVFDFFHIHFYFKNQETLVDEIPKFFMVLSNLAWI